MGDTIQIVLYAWFVLHRFSEFLLRLHAQGLSHEAVIEIMVALLGAMIAVLTLISGLLAVGVTVVGIFGYQTIRDEAARRAELVATDVAKKTATRIANDVKRQVADETQATGLSEVQAEQPERISDSQVSVTSRPRRRRAKNDKSLETGGE